MRFAICCMRLPLSLFLDPPLPPNPKSCLWRPCPWWPPGQIVEFGYCWLRMATINPGLTYQQSPNAWPLLMRFTPLALFLLLLVSPSRGLSSVFSCLFSLSMTCLTPNPIFHRSTLFPDNCKIFTPINSSSNSILFQCDLDALYTWSLSQKLQFYLSECVAMYLYPRPVTMQLPFYSIGDVPVEFTYHHRDLHGCCILWEFSLVKSLGLYHRQGL